MTSQSFRVPILQMRILRPSELLSFSPSHTRLLGIKVKAMVMGAASDSVVEEHCPPVLGRAGPGLGRQAAEGLGERNPLGLQTGVTAAGKYCRGSAQGAAVRSQPRRPQVPREQRSDPSPGGHRCPGSSGQSPAPETTGAQGAAVRAQPRRPQVLTWIHKAQRRGSALGFGPERGFSLS